MKFYLLWALLCLAYIGLKPTTANNPHGAEVDDNDFAEFEEFDDEEVVHDDSAKREPQTKEAPKKVVMSPEADLNEAEDDEAVVEDEDDEFEHLQDEEEFEGFEEADVGRQSSKGHDKPLQDLKITKVPLHLRSNWDSFYMEILMLAGLAVYLFNFLVGKSKNSKLAQAWQNVHKDMLEANFSLVGDDGVSTDPTSGVLMKESENVYSLWCSGRVCCEGMLVTLKLLKRQDLVSSISRLFKPASDQIIVKVKMDETEMDPLVVCVGRKKVLPKMQKDLNDLSWYCPDIKKNPEKYGLPSSLTLLTESHEAALAVLDRQVINCINKFEPLVEYIHITDQYSGQKSQDEQPTSMPVSEKVLLFCFNTPNKGKCSPKDIENMKPLMQLVFYMMDKVRKIRLNREAKVKADKNRQKVEESFMKLSHSQRAEAAQLRKEEKKRADKEKMMLEEDPDKQRKWEAQIEKREMKKKQGKMKMMKIKSA